MSRYTRRWGEKERSCIMVSVIAASALLVPVPPAAGLPAAQTLAYPGFGPVLALGAVVLLIGLLAALAGDLELAQRAPTRARIRRRLPAVWNRADPRVIHLPRSGAGGTHGRVPPRPATGSTPIR